MPSRLVETTPWRQQMTNPEAVVRAAYAAYNAGELERMVGLCSPTIEWSDPDNHLVRGQADLLAHLKWGYDAFPGAQIVVDSLSVDGDRVTTEAEYRGCHSAALSLPDGTTVPPSGRTISFRLAMVGEVHDGLLVAQRSYWDNFDVYTQMGLLSPDNATSLVGEVSK